MSEKQNRDLEKRLKAMDTNLDFLLNEHNNKEIIQKHLQHLDALEKSLKQNDIIYDKKRAEQLKRIEEIFRDSEKYYEK